MNPVAPTRVAALDIARGLAVIGVVLNHAIDGFIAAGLLSADGTLGQVNAALYLFRMPALAFLLGLFIPRSVEKYGTGGYLRRRTELVVWVFLLWTLVQGSVQVALSAVTNSQTTPTQVLTLWVPLAQLWFLPALLTMTIAVVVLRPWGGRWQRCRLALLVIPALLLWGVTPDISGVRGVALVLFVGAGAAIGRAALGRVMTGRGLWWIVAGGGSAILFLVLLRWSLIPATVQAASTLSVRALSIVAAAAGVVLLLALAVLLIRVRVVRPLLARIGRQTMPIYLMHILILAGVRVFASTAGLPADLALVVAIVLGVVIPCVVGENAQRLRLGWLFEAPAFVRRLGRGPADSVRSQAVVRPQVTSRTR